MFRLSLLILLAVSLNACTTTHTPKPTEPQTSAAAIQCPEQRSQICTREYRPVCTSRDTGIRCVTAPCPSSELKTYGNACEACADPKVSEYVPAACPPPNSTTDNRGEI